MKKLLGLSAISIFLLGCPQTKKLDAEVTLEPSRYSVDASQPSYLLNQEEGDVTWYMNFPWFSGDHASTALASQLIKKATGTNIIFIVGDDDRLNQMIASGELPDIITVDKANPIALQAHRWAVPLSSLANAYDPYFFQAGKPDSIAWYTDENGHLWGYPSKSNGYIDYQGENALTGEQAFLVRSDIYQAIGSPNMRTPEGFLQGLRDAKAYAPNVEPLAIEGLGSAGAAADMLMNFLNIHPLQDGKFHDRIFDPEYITWVNVLRQANLEGLISEDNYTNKANEFTEGLQEGKYFMVASSMLMGTGPSMVTYAQRNPDKAYIAIDGPANSKMDDPLLFSEASGIGGWTQTFVTKQAKDKERAIQLITYLLTKEGHIATNLGVEGETYYVGDDGLYYLMPELATQKIEDWEGFLQAYHLGEYWMVEDPTFRYRYTNLTAPQMEQIFQWTRGKQVPLFGLENTNPDARTAEDKQWVTYQDARKDTIVFMIRSKTEEEMMGHLEKLEKLYNSDGVQKALAIKNEKIANNLAKLKKMGYES